MSVTPMKIVLWNCDKCGKQNTLVAYHHTYGWYCEDCLKAIRDKMDKAIDAVESTKQFVNEQLNSLYKETD